MAFGRATTADEVLAGIDLHGKVAIVTGASSGLGGEIVRVLRAHGADVVAAVRDPSRDEDTASAVELDLASLDSVRTAGERLTARLPRIDLLFNNAGVMATPEARTIDGFELQMATNHLGHFLLTALLAPSLAPDARVVNTTSLGHMITGIVWDDPHFRTNPYDKWRAYGQSKTANILFTRGLVDRDVTAHAVHPGAVDTGLTRHLEREELAFVEQASSQESKSLQQGAASPLWAAIAAGIPNGSYIADCQVAEPAAHAIDPVEVDAFWAWSEQQVGHAFRA